MNVHSRGRQGRAGLTLPETMALALCLLLLLVVTLPVLARGNAVSQVGVSLGNLVTMGAAHAVYAADWNGRQATYIYDELAALGDEPQPAFNEYESIFGDDHPAHILGWGVQEASGAVVLYRYFTWNPANQMLIHPITLGNEGEPENMRYYGAFRLLNSRPLHDYIGGRFYDPVFYAPADEAVMSVVEPAFDSPWEYVADLDVADTLGAIPAWSSYCWSPAGHFHPDVMRSPAAGGYRNPWSFDEGLDTPGLFQAAYPSLKTQIIEHNWNQSPPDVCNPDYTGPFGTTYGTYAGCEPYWFNHGLKSAPATLFYDLSARVVPNNQPFAADQRHLAATGEGLWSRDTPYGENGYRIDIGADGAPLSHHILTTGGILGRDVTAISDAALTVWGK